MYLKLHILPLDFLIKAAAQVLRPHLRQSLYLARHLPCDIRPEADSADFYHQYSYRPGKGKSLEKKR
jgi:hypothetical protein